MKLGGYIIIASLAGGSLFLNAENKYSRPEPCPLKGNYAYQMSGLIGAFVVPNKQQPGICDPNVRFDEAGSIFFDGFGQGSARSVTVLDFPPYKLNVSYIFSYTWLSSNLAFLNATRTSDLGVVQVRFIVGVGDDAEHISILFLPNAIPQPELPQRLLNCVQVSGTGGK